jgi:hypothetical protein
MPERPFVGITNEEVYERLRALESMDPEQSSPLTRLVIQNTADIRALRFRYYAILGGVSTGVVTVLAILARSVGL